MRHEIVKPVRRIFWEKTWSLEALRTGMNMVNFIIYYTNSGICKETASAISVAVETKGGD